MTSSGKKRPHHESTSSGTENLAEKPTENAIIVSKHGYKIVALNQWWSRDKVSDEEGQQQPQKDVDGGSIADVALPLIDLRSQEEFSKKWILTSNGAVVVNLPFSSLIEGERSSELPPRNVEFAILVPRSCYSFTDAVRRKVEGSTDLMTEEPKNESSVSTSGIAEINNLQIDESLHNLLFASKSNATGQSRKPWLVRQVLLEGDELWNDASKLGLLAVGSEASGGTAAFKCLPRLWKPDPLISKEILPLLKKWLEDGYSRDEQRFMKRGVIWDLGSGAGRDTCYLAEELKAFSELELSSHDGCKKTSATGSEISNVSFPLRLVGIDNHKGSAKRCTPLWKNRGVADVTKPRLLSLNNIEEVHRQLISAATDDSSNERNECCDDNKEKQVSDAITSSEATNSSVVCLFAVRFLNRKLLSYIASCGEGEDGGSFGACTLGPGTIFGMSHFCKEKNGPWNFDHPKEKSVLERSELRKLFSSSGWWEILKDCICMDGDHGRTLIQFVARKRQHKVDSDATKS